VLGANDGVLSTASLVLGVAAASASRGSMLAAGVAGLVGGAMSMAAGEYVSVSSQSDTEQADLARERIELAENDPGERRELTAIYVARGLDPALAAKVTEQLMAKDALGAHARDELGLSDSQRPRPLQAAAVSALSFAVGAAMPLTITAISPAAVLMPVLCGGSLLALGALGALAASAGGADIKPGAARVAVWGALAMATTTAVGWAFGKIT